MPTPSPISTRLFASSRARRGSWSAGASLIASAAISLALADFTKAIEIDSGFADAFVNRCFAYEDKGKPDLAVKDCTAAIALNPTDAVAYNDRGVAQEKTGNIEGALADYWTAIELDPSYRDAFANRAVLYDHKGERSWPSPIIAPRSPRILPRKTARTLRPR